MGRIRAGLVSGVLVSLLFTAVFGVVLNVPLVSGQPGTIYIRADGSIDPPDASISTVDDVTYTLTGNVTTDVDGIVVERDNIVVDGAGYTLQGTGVYPYKGIDLTGRSNVIIKTINIKGFSEGIEVKGFTVLGGGTNNVIQTNNITNNRYGINLGRASNNKISGNNITNNSYGVFFDYSVKNNTVYRNNITNNELGICLDGYISATYKECPENNTIYENNIADNTEAGVKLLGLGNVFYHNNFLNNTIVMGSEFSSGGTNDPELSKNILDNGYPSGGNYWSDYAGQDLSGDGIGDTPYVIDENNRDRYPIMKSWTPPADTNPSDTDGDGTPNVEDTDDDNDGIPDTWETQEGFNPLDAADASLDPDGDGLTNLQEYQADTNPNASDAQAFPVWIIGVAIAAVGIAVAAVLLWRRRK